MHEPAVVDEGRQLAASASHQDDDRDNDKLVWSEPKALPNTCDRSKRDREHHRNAENMRRPDGLATESARARDQLHEGQLYTRRHIQ